MTPQEIAFLLIRNGITKQTSSPDEYVEANEDEAVRSLGNATIANSLESLGKHGLVADVQPTFSQYGIGFAYRVNQEVVDELSNDDLLSRRIESLFDAPSSETSETIAKLVDKCEQLKSQVIYGEDLISTLKELAICFEFGCYIACMALSGKILEMCFKQLLTNEGISFDTGWTLGKLTGHLERQRIERYLDKSLFDIAKIIIKSRNGAIHTNEKIPVPSREQTIMVIHAVADSVHRIIVDP